MTLDEQLAEGTKADEIAALLEARILAGEIAPGSVLRQDGLAAVHGVSRTPIREAFRRLDALGLVEFRPNRGVIVRGLSSVELADTFVVRAALEGAAVELATVRAPAAAIAGLRAAQVRFEQVTAELRGVPSPDGRLRLAPDWLHANDDFHDRLLEAAGVPLLVRMAQSVRRVFGAQALWADRRLIEEMVDLNLRQHRAIVEAMEARSARAARALAEDHVRSTGELLLRALAGAEATSSRA
jgi:DNA-binding GntR family transcriptional regulator